MSHKVTISIAVQRAFTRWHNAYLNRLVKDVRTGALPAHLEKDRMLDAWLAGYWTGWEDGRTKP